MPGQEANKDNLGMSFGSSVKRKKNGILSSDP